DTVAAAGEDLVRVGLVADVPDQAVARRVEDIMDRGGQLDHAETGAEMAARHRNRIDGFLTQFVGNLPDLLHLQLPQVIRRSDRVEKRRLTICGHSVIPIFSKSRSTARQEMGCAKSKRKRPQNLRMPRASCPIDSLRCAPDRST